MSPRERPALTEDLVRPALATDGPLLSVAVLTCSDGTAAAPLPVLGPQAALRAGSACHGDLASSDCRQRYLAEIAPERAPCRRFSRSLSVAELLMPADEEDHDVCPHCGEDRASDNVSPPQRKPFGGYGVDTPKRA